MAHQPRRPRPSRVLAVVALATGLAAPLAPAQAVMNFGEGARSYVWKGDGRTVRDGDRVRATGPSFNRFLDRRLERLDGDDPTCQGSGAIVVKSWRSDGYAWLPRVGASDPCASSFSSAVAVRDRGVWRTPRSLRGQAPLACTDLSSYSVPPVVYRRQCTVPNGTAVAYRDWFWNRVDDEGAPR